MIGIIGALKEEINLLKNKINLEKKEKIAGRNFYVGKLKEQEVVLVKSGVGKVNAAVTAQLLITVFNVKKIIFTGIAGGIAPHLEIGDLVIASRVAQHDYGNINSKGMTPFKPGSYPFGEAEIDDVYYEVDNVLFNIAKKASQEIIIDDLPEGTLFSQKVRKPMIHKGTVVTGDQFIISKSKQQWLYNTFNALATEMEGGAVTQVCCLNKIPCLLIRSISDKADEKAEINFQKFVNYAASNSLLLVEKILGYI